MNNRKSNVTTLGVSTATVGVVDVQRAPAIPSSPPPFLPLLDLLLSSESSVRRAAEPPRGAQAALRAATRRWARAPARRLEVAIEIVKR